MGWIFIIGIMAILIGVSYAQCPISIRDVEAAVGEETVSEEPEVIDVGNTVCPVSGDEINEETKTTYECEGKIYNLCCDICLEEFKKDPPKYISTMETMGEEE